MRQRISFCCPLRVHVIQRSLRLNVVAANRDVIMQDLNLVCRFIIWAVRVGWVHSQCCGREGRRCQHSAWALSADSSLTACSGVENVGTPQKLLILDARSYTAAVANRAKGGGCECEGTERIPKHFWNLLSLVGPGAGWVRLAFRCSVSGITLPFSVVQSPLLHRNSCWPTRLSRETAYTEIEQCCCGGATKLCVEAIAAVAAAVPECFCLSFVQNITQTVKSCSWAWPTSTPSGTASSICELCAVKCQTPASKSPGSSRGRGAHSA